MQHAQLPHTTVLNIHEALCRAMEVLLYQREKMDSLNVEKLEEDFRDHMRQESTTTFEENDPQDDSLASFVA